MMMDPAIGQSLNQYQQRIGAMEDLLRRNEGSVSAMLGRMKATEIAVTGIHRATSELIPKDMRALSEDTNAIRRRIDGVEQNIRPLISEGIGGLDNDIRNRMAASDDRTQRDLTEVQRSLMGHIGREAESSRIGLSKLNDALMEDVKEGRLTAQDARWACENVRELGKRHADHVNTTDRRIEGTEQQIVITRQQLTDLLNATVDRAVKEVREEIRATNQNHQRLQGSHEELTSVVSRFRDDTVKALSQAATNMRSLDETAQSLETLLKAEVKVRQSKLEELHTRLSFVEGNLAAQADASDSKIAALDSEVAKAIMGVHSSAQAENKVQLDRAWRSITDLRDQMAKVQASQRGQAATILANQAAAANVIYTPSPTKSLNHQSPYGRSRSRQDADGYHNPSLDEEAVVEYVQLPAAAAPTTNVSIIGAVSPQSPKSPPPPPTMTPFPFLDAVLGGDGTTYNQNSVTAQRRLQMQWQADIAILKNELMHAFDNDMSKANQSVLLLMEQQEEIAVVVNGLEKDVAEVRARDGATSPTRLDRMALVDYAKHDELDQLEWRLAAMIKTTTRDLAAARVDLETKMDTVAQRQRDSHLGSPLASPTRHRTEEAGLVAAAAIAAATRNSATKSDSPRFASDEEVHRIDSTVQALTDRTQTGFAEVDYRLHDLEDKSSTLQILQKRLERTWNDDQEHLEACILKLRDDLKFLAVSLGHAEEEKAQRKALQQTPRIPDPAPDTNESHKGGQSKDSPRHRSAEPPSPPPHDVAPKKAVSATPTPPPRPQSASYSDDDSYDSDREPVETSDKAIGTSSRPTPSPPPIPQAAQAVPKLRQPKEKSHPEVLSDNDSMGFSPKGPGSKNIGRRTTTGGSDIPVVDADLNMENGDESASEDSSPKIKPSKEPVKKAAVPTKATGKSVVSPRTNAKNSPPPAPQPSTSSLSGTLKGVKAPQQSQDHTISKAAPLPAMSKQKGGGGGTKTAYDHTAPGWAKPR